MVTKVEEAVAIAIEYLKSGRSKEFGYDFYSLKVARDLAWKQSSDSRKHEGLIRDFYPFFEEAGWVLCQRGVLRPGVSQSNGQAVNNGGYSLTEAGKKKLGELDPSDLLLFQSGSLITTFEGFAQRFGEGFVQRSTEAVRCRDTSLWLASCVMCGAAAEAVLLGIAVEKTQDEKRVFQLYRATGGRQKILDLIAGNAKQYLRDTLSTFSGIIGVWRDQAGHGAATHISQANSDEALRQLLHMCQWVDKEWDNLTRR